MDLFDRAQECEALFRQDAIDHATRRQLKGPGRETCIDCGSPIPEARRCAVPGVERCIACQTELEDGI
ncbi:TraR/DksA family transcriptional regulator [Desulfovibrio psychrotolerans]|uniref:Zinc finger DksA/TraR C4-type domain-containing protein n=1 Tax=Desulfovibrio psychrotolerans TaxID=415242 RepID=A0A7J0BX31_9BACT|nr:TraR/DksA family transcriptional regulator [Desulfovibrio psychrotolerans]GFM37735.1 hypothetical protein DSM19430T_24190 [Desulfovibrio psychrotolerans]